MYTNQCLQVRWGSHTSTRYNVQNGVKQGGVLSPILFSIYIDGMFTRLSNSGIGCHIGHHYAGGVGFADDIKLLSPSNKGLQMMIRFARARYHSVLQMVKKDHDRVRKEKIGLILLVLIV